MYTINRTVLYSIRIGRVIHRNRPAGAKGLWADTDSVDARMRHLL